jgi:hypothetical protein
LFFHIEVIRGEGLGKTTGVHVFIGIDVKNDFFSSRLAFGNKK